MTDWYVSCCSGGDEKQIISDERERASQNHGQQELRQGASTES